MGKRIFQVAMALVFAPLTVIPVIALFGVLTDFESIGDVNYWKWLSIFTMYGVAIAWLTTIVVGLPIYIFMLRLRYSSYLQFGTIGALTAIVGGWYFLMPSSNLHDVEFMCLIAVSGAIVAVAMRSIAGVQVFDDAVGRSLGADDI